MIKQLKYWEYNDYDLKKKKKYRKELLTKPIHFSRTRENKYQFYSLLYPEEVSNTNLISKENNRNLYYDLQGV